MKTYVWDLETSNLRSDIGSLRVASFGELNSDGDIKELMTRDVHDSHGEKNLAEWISHRVIEADILIGHNSITFDKNFMNGVLIRHGLPKLPKRLHLDTMLIAQYGMKGLLQSISLENLADYFRLREGKDKVSKHTWRGANDMEIEPIKRLRKRCESDVRITALLWGKLKEHYYSWRGV